MKPIVLFDVDDVIVDWRGAAHALIGPDAKEICDAFQADRPHSGEVDLWHLIKQQPRFWFDLPMNPWAHELIKFVENQGVDWYFCTAHSRNDHRSASQKIEWAYANGWDAHEKMVITKQKWLCATPNNILVDDKDSNCEEFMRGAPKGKPASENGGTVVVMPQPWNCASLFANSRDRMHYVTALLQRRIDEVRYPELRKLNQARALFDCNSIVTTTV